MSTTSTVWRSDVQAGLQTFRIPLSEGVPAFRVLRQGKEVVKVVSQTPISNTIEYQDFLYRSGSSTRCDRSGLMK